MTEIKHAPGPWEHVPGNENHGPYVVDAVGNTVCDFYAMTNPTLWAACNGAASRPFNFCGEMAEDHAHMVAESPAMLAVLHQVRVFILDQYEDARSKALDGEVVSADARAIWNAVNDQIAKAEGRS